MPRVAESPTSTVGGILEAATNALFVALFALYLWCPMHRFPMARPFHGEHWYNPYGTVTSATAWQKVNLHAHSRAWWGLTNGHGSAEDVLRRFRAMGYDAAPVSNYQEVSRAATAGAGALTVYEHGFNLRKAHFLAIEPRAVDWLDYPLFQGRDEEQYRIDRLRASSAAVIIAHPRLRHAFDTDLRALTGYVALEIASSASRDQSAWDIALDAGRPVWGVADDDIHDADSPNEAGGYWTMFASPNADADALVTALRAGAMYAVIGRDGHADLAVHAVTLHGDTLRVNLRGAPATLALVGPGGTQLGEVTGARSAQWILPCDAAWVRIVARSSTTEIFLEPLLRSEDGQMPGAITTTATGQTVTRRILAVALLMGALSPLVDRAVPRRRESRLASDALAFRFTATG